MPRRPRVLLDTNMLMLNARGIDVFEQIGDLLLSNPEFYVVKPVIDELEAIKSRGGVKERKAADLALELVRRKCRVIDVERKPGESVDDIIVRVAAEKGFIVATSDRELRRKLRRKGIPEIYYREEKQLLEAQGVY